MPSRRLGDSENGLVVQGLSGWRIASEVRRFRQEFDLILVDTPPRTESEARAAIRAADLTLIPCQPNALDVWATAPTIELAGGEASRALLVLNRVPPRSRAAEAAQEEIQKSGWPLASTQLGNRQAFAASLGEGRGVAETAAPESMPNPVRAVIMAASNAPSPPGVGATLARADASRNDTAICVRLGPPPNASTEATAARM